MADLEIGQHNDCDDGNRYRKQCLTRRHLWRKVVTVM